MVELRKYNVPGSSKDYVSVDLDSMFINSVSGEDAESVTTIRLCLERRQYKLSLRSLSGEGWNEGAYLEVYVFYDTKNSILVGRSTLRGMKVKEMTFLPSTELPNYSLPWAVFTGAGEPPADWKTNMNTAEGWTTFQMENGHGPAVDRPVWFLKQQVTTNNVASSHSYEMGVYCRAGVVVYINGKEVYRAYVPEGEVSSSTTITGGKATPYWHRIIGLQKNFITGVNTIALAVVNTPANRNVTIDANVRLYFSLSSLDMPLSVSLTAETTDDSISYPVSNLFDGDYRTRAMMPRASNTTITGPQYWGFHFDDESAVAVSRYCFVSNDAAGRYDPISWDLYASTTGKGDTLTQWTFFGSWDTIKWNARNERMCFTIPQMEYPYRYYRFVMKSNANQVPDNFFSLAEIELYTVNVESFADSDLSYNPSSVIVYHSIAMSSMQPSLSGFSQCSITPELPYGLSIDAYTGVISGTPVGAMEMTSYSVTCKNQRGSSRTATIAITVQSCVLPKRLFSVSVPDVGELGEHILLTLSVGANQIAQYQGLRNYATHTVTACVDPSSATLTFNGVNDYNLGSKYAIVRLADNRELFRTGAQKERITFYPFYAVDESSTWRYSYGAMPQEGWQTNNGTEAWSATEAGKFPATESVAQYYSTTFALSNFNEFVAFDLQVRIQAGMRMWLNGQLISFLNLPFTGMTNETLASTQYAIPQMRKSSSLNTNLQANNVLAVEIHRGSNIPSSNTFLLKFLPVPQSQSRVIEGSASSNVAGLAESDVSLAFDGNANTFFQHDGVCEGTTLEWDYDGASTHAVNKYVITADSSCSHLAPSSWKFEGSHDGVSWTLLDVQSSVQWSVTAEAKAFLFYQENAYSMYRLTVTRCQSRDMIVSDCPVSGLKIADISLQVGSIAAEQICHPAGGFPSAISGTYAYAACDMNYSGYKRRLCSNGVFQNIELFCTVSAPSSFSYPRDSYELIAEAPISPAITPAIVCNDCAFTISPELPSGMVLDSARGVLSGTPLNITSNTHYTIVASNVAGSASLVLDILTTNETVHCFMDLLNGWETTLANTTAIKACPNADYEGNVTRYCNYGSPAYWSGEVNNCVLLIPNITLTNTTFSFVKNEQIAPIVPIITGSGITSRTISPTLPAGLYFNPATATISGKPTQRIAQTMFTITVRNNNGAATATLQITVTAFTCAASDGWAETDSGDTAYKVCETNKEGNWYRVCSSANPPVWENPVNQCSYIKPVVTYSSSSYALQRGQQVSLVPTTQFYITSWSITGQLPTGLTFSNSNGAITGSPTTITALTTVTINAANPDKTTQVTLAFSVNVYKCNADGVWPETEVGNTFTLACDNTALMEGDRKRTCNYVSGAVSWSEVVDTCKYKAPILVYSTTTISVRKGEALVTVTPQTGNQIDSITIAPSLPAGLAFHSGSGAISGTPTGDASNLAYTVTASNRDEQTQVVLQIIVSVAACTPDGSWKETERGETAYIWCANGAGVQSRVCGTVTDTNPQWKGIDNSGCVSSPEKQKPAEGQAFVRFTLQLAGVTSSSFDAYAYAALRRVLVSGLSAQSVTANDILLESHSAGTFSVLAEGTSLRVRVITGVDNGNNLKDSIVNLGKTTLTSLVRNSGVAALGSATATVVESSFEITKYSLFNSLASVLIVIVIILGVVLLLIGVFLFLARRKSGGKKNSHSRMENKNRLGHRTKQANVKGSKHHYEEEEEEERPRKKSKKSHYEDEEERPKKKSKKSHYEEEEEERPKKKSKASRYEEEEEEERPKKKSKKSKRYDDSE